MDIKQENHLIIFTPSLPHLAPCGSISVQGWTGTLKFYPCAWMRAIPKYSHTLKRGPHSMNEITGQKPQGLNGESIFVYLPAFSCTNSCPHECMHLLWENIVPMLVDFWTGRFKGLDKGTGNYHIHDVHWELIGKESVAAHLTIPAMSAVQFLTSPKNDIFLLLKHRHSGQCISPHIYLKATYLLSIINTSFFLLTLSRSYSSSL
jgi:hypothetical protein